MVDRQHKLIFLHTVSVVNSKHRFVVLRRHTVAVVFHRNLIQHQISLIKLKRSGVVQLKAGIPSAAVHLKISLHRGQLGNKEPRHQHHRSHMKQVHTDSVGQPAAYRCDKKAKNGQDRHRCQTPHYGIQPQLACRGRNPGCAHNQSDRQCNQSDSAHNETTDFIKFLHLSSFLLNVLNRRAVLPPASTKVIIRQFPQSRI